MFEFTINRAGLLNEFLRGFSDYVNKSYKFTMKFLASPERADFSENDRLVLIAVNKSVYQNLYSFLRLNDSHMQYAAFACLENAVYAMRLFSVIAPYTEYRYKFLTDLEFSLADCEDELAQDDGEFDENMEHFSLKEFCEGIHRVNTFELKTASISSQLNDGSLYLGLSCGNTLSDELQDEVRKNLIGAFVALTKYAKMFESDGVDKELKELEDSLYSRFLEYLKN